MHTFVIVSLIAAAVCFAGAAFGATRVNLLALGLLAFVLSVLVPLV